MTAPDFADGKDAGALRTIGEVSAALGIKTHVLRYWEGQFDMLQPLKRSGGRRYYRPADVALVKEIDRLVNHQGYTLRGAKVAIRGFAGQVALPPVLPQEQNHTAETMSLIPPTSLARLRAIRGSLHAALEASAG